MRLKLCWKPCAGNPARREFISPFCTAADVASSGTYGIPEILSVLLIIVLHKWKKNTLLSIGGGTALYMLIVQTVFK